MRFSAYVSHLSGISRIKRTVAPYRHPRSLHHRHPRSLLSGGGDGSAPA